MPRTIAVLAAVAAATCAVPAAAEPLAAWLGQWHGKCEIAPAYRGVAAFDASLTVAPAGPPGRYTWQQIYEAIGPTPRSVRNYELVAVDAAKGHYVLDEKNGLMLDAFLAARTLHMYFMIGGTRIPAIYVLVDVLLTDREIVISLPAYHQAPARNSCVTGQANQCAESYRLTGAQTCRLRRR